MSTAQPLVSFCMSTYGRPVLLLEQLKCILCQEYKNIEIVVSDNDPEQSARQVVENINDSRAKYFPNVENLGMINSFNKSIQRSTGEYIVMIADDDPTYPHMLTDLLDLTVKYPGYGLYGGCGDWLVENDFASKTLGVQLGKTSHLLKSIPENEVCVMPAPEFATAYLDGFFSTTFLLWSCLMVKRDVLVSINGVPNYGSELLGDHAYVIAVGSVDGMVFINKTMGGQVVHGKNFGYDIFSIKEKYINTPAWFFGYLKSQLNKKENWQQVEKKIWDFAGRTWVEYTMLLRRSLKTSEEKKEFSKLFSLAFSNPNIHKWKYKFYLKFYCRPLFNVLLSIKRIWT